MPGRDELQALAEEVAAAAEEERQADEDSDAAYRRLEQARRRLEDAVHALAAAVPAPPPAKPTRLTPARDPLLGHRPLEGRATPDPDLTIRRSVRGRCPAAYIHGPSGPTLACESIEGHLGPHSWTDRAAELQRRDHPEAAG